MQSHDQGRYLSQAGRAKLFLAQEPCCATCGAPFFGELLTTRQCPHCRDLDPAYQHGRTLFVLGREGRALIHTYKYRGGTWLLPDFVHLATQLPHYLKALHGAILVPVPLHKKRLRQRGYNQSLLLAKALAHPIAPHSQVQDILVRTRDTLSQTRLDREDRRKNMHHAFSVKPKANVSAQARYVIIDDVFTTGATLNACAIALQEAGAQHIDVATMAHG